METNQVRQNHNSGQVNGKKVFFWTLGIAGAGAGGYLLWDYLRKRKAQQDAASYQPPMVQNIYLPASGSSSSATTRTDNFPLKRGSKGERVRQLQLALQRILGTTGLAKYTQVDGDYGPGTEDAVKAAGLPTSMDETTFNRLVGGNTTLTTTTPSSGSYSYYDIAQGLFSAASTGNIQQVLTSLSNIRSVNEYVEVSNFYKQITEQKTGVTQTIVTGLLDVSFKYNESAKILLRDAFKKIGLYESGGKWSTTPPMLSGIKQHKDIITLVNTYVQDKSGNRHVVQKSTILGEEQYTANGLTYFKAIDQSEFVVPTRDIKYV